MHISEMSQPSNFEKISLTERIWQFVRFTVVTGIIFCVSFFVINFNAYKQIISTALNPEAQAQAEEALDVATGNKTNVKATDLLPVLPEKKEIRKQFSWVSTPIAPTDNRLVIPKLGLSVPIVAMGTEYIEGENWTELEKQIQDSLKDGVVHYPGTAAPGQFGNFFLTGHSSYYPWDSGKFKDVFALLGRLEVGDHYTVYYHQKQHTYTVTEKKEVMPTNVTVLEQPADKKVSTLMTCTPVGTTLRRLIIHAEEAV